MLSCKDMAKKANDYIDRDLSLLMRLKFGMHLFMCVHCRNYISQMRTTVKALQMRHSEEDQQISGEDVGKIVDMIKKKFPEEK